MEITNVEEYEPLAKQRLPKMVFDYYASGAEDQWTLKENRNAFSRILGTFGKLWLSIVSFASFPVSPQILIDVSHIDLSTTVLGYKISMPIMISPTAMQKMAHPDGMVYKNRNVVAQLVRRAEKAGFKAIALTVDTPRLGRREADIKNRFNLPPHLTLKNFEGLDLGKMEKTSDSGLASYVAGQIDRSLEWKDIQWLQTITKLPILVKGVMTAEDTRLSIQHGAAGIIVSNHGARQLDYVPATISCLEEVVKAAQGQFLCSLMVESVCGTDVFKALALGASGIFPSYPLIDLRLEGLSCTLWLLKAGGKNVLQMLRDEFELTMALAGCRSLKEITRNHIVTDSDPPRPVSRL
ncbi:hypothetical protein IFM89_016790 [Coptis chinensis]|uniref:(S)-2-hydroxy-acid oxidase n=1 Tax=Coptis chinensis TaxID=261450 RepID=A0A835GZN4_9MAGN|nr:hypothetical protein IFM89_016790 [Coptis chinensis]